MYRTTTRSRRGKHRSEGASCATAPTGWTSPRGSPRMGRARRQVARPAGRRFPWMRRNGCGVEERMRKGLTFEAAKTQHRRRGRSLIFAGVAALAVGMTLSFVVSSAWGADRQDAAQTRFDDAVATQRGRVEDTVRAYRRMLTVTQGFFEVADPTPAQFARFSGSLELTDAHPAGDRAGVHRAPTRWRPGRVELSRDDGRSGERGANAAVQRSRRGSERPSGAGSSGAERRPDDDAAEGEHLRSDADATRRAGASRRSLRRVGRRDARPGHPRAGDARHAGDRACSRRFAGMPTVRCSERRSASEASSGDIADAIDGRPRR